MRFGTLALAGLLVLACGPLAHAQLAFDVTGGFLNPYGGTDTVGYTFNVLTPLNVTELNIYAALNGFESAAIPVGIWNNGGTLLTSASISITSPITITSSAQGGNFFGTPIATLALTPGTYTIGAFGTGRDTFLGGGTIIADPSVSYGSGGITTSGSLTRPIPTLPGVGIFGPSFKFNAAPADVPEPGSIALLTGMGVVEVGFLRRRKQIAYKAA